MYIGVVGHVVALGKGGTRDGRRSGAARESEERTAADQRPVARLRGARTAMTDNATMRFIPFLLILPDLSTAADRKTSKSGPRDGTKIQPVAASRIAESVVQTSYPLRLAKLMRRPLGALARSMNYRDAEKT